MDHRVKAMPPHRKVSFSMIIRLESSHSRKCQLTLEISLQFRVDPTRKMQIFESVETSRAPEAEEIYFVVQTGRKEMFIFFTAPSCRDLKKMHIFMKIINFFLSEMLKRWPVHAVIEPSRVLFDYFTTFFFL
jgi:hypothetical protein